MTSDALTYESYFRSAFDLQQQYYGIITCL